MAVVVVVVLALVVVVIVMILLAVPARGDVCYTYSKAGPLRSAK